MRGPLPLDDFAKLADIPSADIELYREAGLLDPDGDGLYDDFDALRLLYVSIHVDQGRTIEEIVGGIRDGTLDAPFFGDVLFGRGQLWGRVAPAYTVPDAAERTGLTSEQIELLRTVSGLPGNLIEQRDIEAMAGVKSVLDAGMPWEAIVEVSRVYGDALRRIAEAEVRMMHEHVHERMASEGVPEREIALQTHALMRAMTDVVDPTIEYIHHQHLLRLVMEDVLAHMESPQVSRRRWREATILFVDLSSYTSLSQVHGDEAAAAVLERFDGLVRSLLPAHRGTLVKQIGDAFMLTFSEPADAVRFGVAVGESAMTEENFPSVRVGIHTGPVLYRMGDYIGNTVNIAARIAAAAAPDEIVFSESIAEAAQESGLPVAPVGMRMLRGVDDPLPLYRVMRRRDMPARDPVCGMNVLADAAARLTWGGVDYAFCSEDCLRRFVGEPDRYATSAAHGPNQP